MSTSRPRAVSRAGIQGRFRGHRLGQTRQSPGLGPGDAFDAHGQLSLSEACRRPDGREDVALPGIRAVGVPRPCRTHPDPAAPRLSTRAGPERASESRSSPGAGTSQSRKDQAVDTPVGVQTVRRITADTGAQSSCCGWTMATPSPACVYMSAEPSNRPACRSGQFCSARSIRVDSSATNASRVSASQFR